MISVVTWNMDYWKRNKEQRQDAWDYLTDEIRPDCTTSGVRAGS